MSCVAGLDFLKYARFSQVYLLRDGVFVRPNRGRATAPRRVTSLAAQAKIMVHQLHRRSADALPVGYQVRERLARLPEFAFVIRELVPYLRFLDSGDPSCLVCPPHVQAMLAELSAQAPALRPAFGAPKCQAIPPSFLASVFPMPCVIMDQRVVPLQRLARILHECEASCA